MIISADVKGLDEAINALQAAFPKNETRQRGIINSSMRSAASKTILPVAKDLAKSGDSSGSLSEALGIRAQSKRKLRTRGVVAGVEVVPVRFNRKAISLYIQHYYTNQGRTAPASIVSSGIRHGHLVEFGSLNNSARPFLYPAGRARGQAFIDQFAKDIWPKMEKAVQREAKKSK